MFLKIAPYNVLEIARILAREKKLFRRGVRETTCLRREEGNIMNHNRGRHDVPNVYNPIIKPTVHVTGQRLQSVI